MLQQRFSPGSECAMAIADWNCHIHSCVYIGINVSIFCSVVRGVLRERSTATKCLDEQEGDSSDEYW